MTYFYSDPCPHCSGQGRLVILRDTSRGELYLHCEECEWGWRDPAHRDEPAEAFLTLLEDFESEEPTAAEIDAAGWSRYVRSGGE